MIHRVQITHALIELLNTGVTGLSNDAPTNPFGQTAPEPIKYPYGILYPLPGLNVLDDFVGSARQGFLPYQVTSVGQNSDQADGLADQVRAVMLDLANHPAPIANSNAVIGSREIDTGPGTPQSVPNTNIWSVPERFLIYVDAP